MTTPNPPRRSDDDDTTAPKRPPVNPPVLDWWRQRSLEIDRASIDITRPLL